jgi:hypothetical protein
MRVFVRLALAALATCLALAQPAFAQDDEDIAQGVFNKETWPLQTIHRPLTLAGGMLEIRGDSLRIGLSKNSDLDPEVGFGDPIVLAPDVFYGVNSQFTLGITHTNRFGSFAPAGFCVSGDLCRDRAYNAIGAEAQYGLTRGGNVGLMAHGGLSAPAFKFVDDKFTMGLLAGVTLRGKGGNIAVVLDPTIYVGIINRPKELDTGIPDPGIKETVFLPIDIQYQLNTQSMIFLSSGVYGQLDGFGDNYQIPAGIGANFAINNRADLGGEIEFANLAGKDTTFKKFQERTFIARLAIRI